MKNIYTLILFFLLLINKSISGSFSDSIKYKANAIRTTESIKVDGRLDEIVWQRSGISDFTQKDPVEFAKATEQTEVLIAYDNNSIYFAAILYDSRPDSIIGGLIRRDMQLESDWFTVYIDPYYDKQSGFTFSVNPSGSISDGIIYNDSWTDDSWDGVWDVAVKTFEKGWIIEMQIPYSQIRFKEKDKYIWGCNFKRYISRKKESDYLVMTPKSENGLASHFADLLGIENIHPPQRIEILPYALSSGKFVKHEAGDPFNKGRLLNGNFGGDLKIGIGGNLTLNGTINPDFGQVEVDPAVVNLSQFETYYQEKRPFFIEGSNIFEFGYGGATSFWGFNWGGSNIFYSRRIGRAPQGYTQHDGFVDIPGNTTISGAAKISGKIQSDWSIGMILAQTPSEYAKIDSSGIRFSEKVEPTTFYSIIRSQKEFNNGKQGIGVIGTGTFRSLDQDLLSKTLNKNALVYGVDGWSFLDSSKTWVITGYTGFSNITGDKNKIINIQKNPQHYYQRPDISHIKLDSNITNLSGWIGRFSFNKEKGNLKFNAALGAISPGFEINDLGYQSRADIINAHVVTGYDWYDPDEIFRNRGFSVATFRSYNFGGDLTSSGYMFSAYAQFHNYWDTYFGLFVNPSVYAANYTRGGPYISSPAGKSINFSLSSDSRKPLILNLSSYYSWNSAGNISWSFYSGFVWKPKPTFILSFSPEYSKDQALQWVTSIQDKYANITYGYRYIFAELNQTTFSGSIRIDWTFTPKLSFQLYLQPLFSVGKYSGFKELAKGRTYDFNIYGENNSTINYEKCEYQIDPDGNGPAPNFSISDPNFNFKSLRGNAVIRWEYLPGSTLYLVWTHERTNSDDPGSFKMDRDFQSLMGVEPDNIFLIKLTYWLNI